MAHPCLLFNLLWCDCIAVTGGMSGDRLSHARRARPAIGAWSEAVWRRGTLHLGLSWGWGEWIAWTVAATAAHRRRVTTRTW